MVTGKSTVPESGSTIVKPSAASAFDMLRAASNVTNRKLRDIAADLCENGGLSQGGPRGMV